MAHFTGKFKLRQHLSGSESSHQEQIVAVGDQIPTVFNHSASGTELNAGD